jgi:MFS family permease
MLVITENNRSFYGATLTIFLLWVEWGVATSLLPIQVYELGGTPLEVGLVFSIFAALMFPSNIVWGSLSDYTGRKKPFIVIGMMGLLPVYLIMATQRSPITLILLRGSTAIFKGAVETCTWSLASDISSPEVVGRNLGVLSLAGVAGNAVGPILGGFVVDNFGFPTLWLLVAVSSFTGGIVFLVAGSESTKFKRRGNTTPLIAFKTLKNDSRILLLSLAFAVLLLGFSFLGPNLNVYLTRELGYTKTLIGVLSFIGAGTAAVAQPLFGHLSDKHGRRIAMILGCLSLSLGHIILLVGREVYIVVVTYVLINSYNSFRTAASAYISDIVDPAGRSGVIGTLNAVGSIARSISSAAGGLVIGATDVPTAIKIAAVFPFLSILIVVFAVKETKTRL